MWIGQFDYKFMFGFGNDFRIDKNPNHNNGSFVNLSGAFRNSKFKNNKQGWLKFTGSQTENFKVN